MKMKRSAIAIGTVSILAVTIGLFWKPVSNAVFVRTQLELEIHPLWKDLNSGKFKAGSNLESLVATHTPSFQSQVGPYSVLTFLKDYNGNGIPFSGLTVTARDGKLIYAEAGSCTWRKVFFDDVTPDDQRKMDELAGDPSREF